MRLNVIFVLTRSERGVYKMFLKCQINKIRESIDDRSLISTMKLNVIFVLTSNKKSVDKVSLKYKAD